MEREFYIKGHRFGTGKPIICAPVLEVTKPKIVEMVKQMVAQKVEMIEWRMDWFETWNDAEAVIDVLKELKDYVRETVLLCTFRSEKQGGQCPISNEAYFGLNHRIAGTGVPDFIDIEFFEAEEPELFIKQIQESGVKVIASNHNFSETPETTRIFEQFQQMYNAGADYAKVAVMPKKKTDVLRLMEATLLMKEQYSDSHLIAMSMDKEGVISRLLGQWYGSEVTFAAFGKVSAPGQIPYEDVEKILQQIGVWVDE